MPTYEYTCRDCGHRFEIVQSMLDEPLTMCPECGGSLRKVFAPPAIAFKGAGFYATDHGKRSKEPEDDSAGKATKKKEKSEPSGSKDAAGDTGKPATTAPSKKEPAAP